MAKRGKSNKLNLTFQIRSAEFEAFSCFTLKRSKKILLPTFYKDRLFTIFTHIKKTH